MKVTATRAALRAATIVSTAVAAILTAPGAGWANTAASGRQFGRHVVDCAQTMGLSGDHEPGMHRGFAGYDPTHTC